MTILNGVIADNQAATGGGIANTGTLSLDLVSFAGNSASGDGGALYNAGIASLEFCLISGNKAAGGGGIFNAPAGSVTLIGTLVLGNQKDDIEGSVTVV